MSLIAELGEVRSRITQAQIAIDNPYRRYLQRMTGVLPFWHHHNLQQQELYGLFCKSLNTATEQLMGELDIRPMEYALYETGFDDEFVPIYERKCKISLLLNFRPSYMNQWVDLEYQALQLSKTEKLNLGSFQPLLIPETTREDIMLDARDAMKYLRSPRSVKLISAKVFTHDVSEGGIKELLTVALSNPKLILPEGVKV